MTTQSEIFTGGCTCGQLRYQVNATPLIVHGCHCRWCQRQSGASFAVNALIEADRVEITAGDVSETTVESPSGSGQRITRCPECQVAVWSNYLVFAGTLGEHIRFIKVGTLDNPDRFPPDIHIYTSTRQPWVTLPANKPAVSEYYKTSEVWPAESLDRLSVLLKAADA